MLPVSNHLSVSITANAHLVRRATFVLNALHTHTHTPQIPSAGSVFAFMAVPRNEKSPAKAHQMTAYTYSGVWRVRGGIGPQERGCDRATFKREFIAAELEWISSSSAKP